MKLPRDVSGKELIRALVRIGYSEVRQKGSHAYLVSRKGDHHVAVPLHTPLKVGTFAAILSDVAMHLKIDREELLDRLFS